MISTRPIFSSNEVLPAPSGNSGGGIDQSRPERARDLTSAREQTEREEGGMAEQRRALLPFLQRAEEVQKVEPRIAYYCRLYAVEEGLKLQNRDKAIDELLFSVMDKLESYKSKNTLVPEEDKLQLEGFALKIFDRADRVDRAGRADMSTCKAFYAASVFMEVCTQFGDLDEDLLGKQKYAAWKAADIRKAIREGRKPTVGSGKPHMASSAFRPPLSRFADTLSHVSPQKTQASWRRITRRVTRWYARRARAPCRWREPCSLRWEARFWFPCPREPR